MYYAYGQNQSALNNSPNKKKKKKRKTILDNPIPVLQQHQQSQNYQAGGPNYKDQLQKQRDNERKQGIVSQNSTIQNFNQKLVTKKPPTPSESEKFTSLSASKDHRDQNAITDATNQQHLSQSFHQYDNNSALQHQPSQLEKSSKTTKASKTKNLGSNHMHPVNSQYQAQYLPSIHSLISTTYEGGFRHTGRGLPVHNTFSHILSTKNKQVTPSIGQTLLHQGSIGGKSEVNKNINQDYQRIEQLLKEQKIIKTKASFYNQSLMGVLTKNGSGLLHAGSVYLPSNSPNDFSSSKKQRDTSNDGKTAIQRQNDNTSHIMLLNTSDLDIEQNSIQSIKKHSLNGTKYTQSLSASKDKNMAKFSAHKAHNPSASKILLRNEIQSQRSIVDQLDSQYEDESHSETNINDSFDQNIPAVSALDAQNQFGLDSQKSQQQFQRSIQQIQNNQYKLPSIKSNESIGKQDEISQINQIVNGKFKGSVFSKQLQPQQQNNNQNYFQQPQNSLQGIGSLNQQIKNSILEESNQIFMMDKQSKNASKKFVNTRVTGSKQYFINEFIDNKKNQQNVGSVKQQVVERNSLNNQNSTPSSTAGQKKKPSNITTSSSTQRQQDQETALILTDEEKSIYGNRFPSYYKRVKLLGRGGCALVWLAKDEKSGDRLVAIKQFPKSNNQAANLESGYSELQMNKRFFAYNGLPNEAYAQNLGINNLCKLLDSRDEKQDLWLIFELCGKPLSKTIFDVKGEFYKGERIYQVLHKQELFRILEMNQGSIFKDFIKSMANVLHLFQSAGIVHSDLKPENILILHDQQSGDLSYKIIDLGSSFNFQKTNQDIELTTPEYLSPDILDYLDQKSGLLMGGQGIPSQNDLTKKLFPWSIDIWSLGAILLEVVTGFPLWLSYKGRIVKDTSQNQKTNQRGKETSSSACMTGLFGIQGRVPKKIKQKQIQTVQQLRQILKKQFSSELCLGGFNRNEDFLDLLSRMLELNPKLRISPKEILEHPFLQIE